MLEIFRPMNEAVALYRTGLNGFGKGHDMQEAACKAAPEWLKNWNSNRRWSCCFTQGWEGLVAMARAFGWSQETLLADLNYYYCRSLRSSASNSF